MIMYLHFQGFASGDVDQDAAALRYFVDEGHTVLLAQVLNPILNPGTCILVYM